MTTVKEADVRRAWEALKRAGKHPSDDAIRAYIGHGSKSTIFKYRKKIEKDEAEGRNLKLSQAILDKAQELANDLYAEVFEDIQEVRAEAAVKEKALQAEIAALAESLKKSEEMHGVYRGRCELLEKDKVAQDAQLREEVLQRQRANQRAEILETRLNMVIDEKQSLEEKYNHAVTSLEHFRDASQKQREQEKRQHEQQIQQLHAERRAVMQDLMVKIEQSAALQEQKGRLEGDLASSNHSCERLRSEIVEISSKLEAANERVTQLAVVEARLLDAINERKMLLDQLASAQSLLTQAQAATEQAQSALKAEQASTASLRKILESYDRQPEDKNRN